MITFFVSPGAVQGPNPVQGGLAASHIGRYAGTMVWECAAGIRWMAHMEGTRIPVLGTRGGGGLEIVLNLINFLPPRLAIGVGET